MIESLEKVQKVVNMRMSSLIRIIKIMAEFKENIHTRDSNMGILERVVMVIIARSIYVRRVSVIEDWKHPPPKFNLKECFKRALDAKRIIRYKQSGKWFGTWIVWYVE